MKKTIKRLVLSLVCILTVSATALADNDRPVNVNQLPQTAQQVIKKQFAGSKIALAKQETDMFGKSFDVIFTNGNKIEFDRNGNWTDIDCKHSAVPSALIPSQIRNYVNKSYNGQKVIQIERDRKTYEVKLSGGIELTFNKQFRLIDIDN